MTLAGVAHSAAYDPSSWDTFFVLTGTAAATLTGLFFIAFSLRVQEFQLSLALRTRARYLLIWLIAIALASGFVLMPRQPRGALAAEILVVSAGCAAYTAWSSLRTARREPLALSADLLARWLGMGVTCLLSVGAGIGLLAGFGGGFYLLGFALLLGIALEVGAAWSLVVGAGKDSTPGEPHTPARRPTEAGRLPE